MSADTTFEPGQDDGQQELSVEQLQAQLAAEQEMRQRLESNLDHERSRLDAFLSKAPEQKTEAAEPLGPPPDLIENPDAYRAWVVEKDRRSQLEIEKRLQAQQEEFRSEIASAESRVNLWQAFQTMYPEHAKLTKIAGYAFQELNKQGGLPGDVAGISDAIAAKMDSMVGSSIANLKPQANRTADTSGGEVASPKKKVATDEDDDAPSTMHSAIAEFQKNHGLI